MGAWVPVQCPQSARAQPLPPVAVRLCHLPMHASYDCRSAGFRSTRRTKLIATIGPACDSEQMLEQMAVGGTATRS